MTGIRVPSGEYGREPPITALIVPIVVDAVYEQTDCILATEVISEVVGNISPM
jgi:hypothetical protein